MKLNTGCKTCVGNTRENNQDSVVLRSTERDGQYFIILAVCDGIGGMEKGELASSLVVQRINEWYDSVLQWLDIRTVEPKLMNSHLKDLAEECNSLVRQCQQTEQIQTGTTMSLLMIVRENYYIIQVGDSRVYRYRDSALEQITRDASVTRMKNGRMKLYLDNFLGKQDELWFTCTAGEIQKRDLFLVCSDGLYHHMTMEDIQEIEKNARKGKKIISACDQLLQWMMERGETDNITVGLITVD